jgi:NADPH:quinone reductase-like Zn-dependent oxidoreductase
MKAITRSEYGTPDVLRYEEIERPVPGEHEVLVRVRAAAASTGDHHVVTGKPYLIRLTPFGGVPRPRHRVPGACLAGVVEAVGAKVEGFRPGDEVFGQAPSGAFAEYVSVASHLLAPKPTGLPFDEAAALPWAVAALQGLRDVGRLQPGQTVLINGASGGVGTAAVQIARALGAHVTAVCSTRNLEMVRALGANEVVDYTKEDFVRPGARYDLVFDTVGNRRLTEYGSVLTDGGILVSASGGDSGIGWAWRLVAMALLSLAGRRSYKGLFTRPNGKDLLVLKALADSESLRPMIEKRFPLSGTADALRHVGGGRAQGQTVIQVAGVS